MPAFGPDSDPSTHEYRSAATGPVPTTPHGPPARTTAGLSPGTVPDAAPTAPPTARPFLPPHGAYELLHHPGEGGIGVLYQARERSTGRMLAQDTQRPAAPPSR